MLKLKTNLTLKAVQKSEKLQGIKCGTYWNPYYRKAGREERKEGIREVLKGYSVCRYKCYKCYNAPTIADIIDNAEELFGSDKDSYGYKKYIRISYQIIGMCIEFSKPLQEIEEYIIKNLKQ